MSYDHDLPLGQQCWSRLERRLVVVICKTANCGAHCTVVPGKPDLEATTNDAIALAALVSALISILLAQKPQANG